MRSQRPLLVRPDHAIVTHTSLDSRGRIALVRRDRTRLADPVAGAVERARTSPTPQPGDVVSVAEQVLLATPVLRDIEQLLRGDELLDSRGVHLVGRLLYDVRIARTTLGDPLAIDEAARDARHALHPVGRRRPESGMVAESRRRRTH